MKSVQFRTILLFEFTDNRKAHCRRLSHALGKFQISKCTAWMSFLGYSVITKACTHTICIYLIDYLPGLYTNHTLILNHYSSY